MFVDDDFDGPARQDDSGTDVDGKCRTEDGKVHGTSMLGFVTGRHLGLSKNVEPWLVRMPRRNPNGKGSTPYDWIRGLSMINQRITERSETTQAVVLLSWLYDFRTLRGRGREFLLAWEEDLFNEINNLIEKGVFVVTGSGNNEEVSSRLGGPARLGFFSALTKSLT